VFKVIKYDKKFDAYEYQKIIWESDDSHTSLFGKDSALDKHSVVFSPECHRDLIMAILSSKESISVNWDLYNEACK
jgi:hypothetical protein